MRRYCGFGKQPSGALIGGACGIGGVAVTPISTGKNEPPSVIVSTVDVVCALGANAIAATRYGTGRRTQPSSTRLPSTKKLARSTPTTGRKYTYAVAGRAAGLDSTIAMRCSTP